jgi:hypothetical protein
VREANLWVMSESRHWPSRLIEQIALRPDVIRGLRASVAVLVSLIVCHALRRPTAAVFIALTAQYLSFQDLRGAYPVRLTILATMTLVAAGSALLGVLTADNTLYATLAMGAIALLGGCWRHLSADYGPALAVFSALLFLLGLSQPGGLPAGLHLAGLVGIGGAGATLMQIGFWLFRPQYPLRYAVAETWVATSDLVASMRPGASTGDDSRHEPIASRERELRVLLDRTFLILGAAEKHQKSSFIAHLEAMRREVVHLAMRVLAFNTSLESLVDRPDFARSLPVLDSVLKALSDAARSVAVTLMIYRPENLAACQMRLRRCQHLIRVLDEQIAAIPAADVAVMQARATLEQIAQVLPRIAAALGETVDHGAPRWSFPWTLPEIGTRSIQSLAAWINPAPRLDPVLVRHAARMAVLTMFAVALYKRFAIPHGYWIAFTIIAVLQPDYGSTRQRAGERMAGTLAGSVLASALLWIKMPLFLLDGLAALTSFGFAYFLKRRYALAVFFITILIVLLTETTAPVHLDFTLVRILSTLLGGGLALVAALVFWPVWEREKFPTLLAAAIRANRTYLESLAVWLGMEEIRPVTPLMAKRRAENANRFAAASLERLLSEPARRHENPERAAALATYNQRLTRALTVLAVNLEDGRRINDPGVSAVVRQISEVLESLGRAIENGYQDSATAGLAVNLGRLEAAFAGADLGSARRPDPMSSPDNLIWSQLAKTIAEIRVMALALNATPTPPAQATVKGH